MKNESIQLTDSVTTTTRNKKTGVVTSSVRTVRSKNIQIVSSGIVSGNRVTPNPWSYNIVKQDMMTGRIFQQDATTTRVTEGLMSSDLNGGGVWLTPWSSSMNTLLYNEALSKLNDKLRGGLDMSEDIADRRNVNRINRSMISLVELADQVSRGARGKIAVISSLWLSRQYTWRPLVSTIYDAANNILTRADRPVNASASAWRPVPDLVKANFAVHGYAPTSVPVNYSCDGKYVCKIGVRVKSNKLLLGNFTSLDPSVLAWNLLPYSFVVDWCFNVGEYLRNQETVTRYSAAFIGGYVSYLLAENVRGEIAYSGNWAGFPSNISGRSGAKNVRFQRSVLSSYPSPRLPVLNLELSLERMFTLAALLGTRLGIRR